MSIDWYKPAKRPASIAPTTKPAFIYTGGKSRIADWVIGHFPPHVTYVEPYAGAASVLLRKERARLEVLNDLDGDITNFFRVLREHPGRLIRQLQLTPYARDEFLDCVQNPYRGDDVERARRFYVRVMQSLARIAVNQSTWRKRNAPHKDRSHYEWRSIEHLWSVADRLAGVLIDNMPALEIIGYFDSPETLFYIDPPYVGSTRVGGSIRYLNEMSEKDHRELAEALSNIEGLAVVSGYWSPLYAGLYRGWGQAQRSAVAFKGKRVTEVLWISPRAWEMVKGHDTPPLLAAIEAARDGHDVS